MLHTLFAAALAASAAGSMMILPEPAVPPPATTDAPHLKIEIEAFDAAGHRVSFDGVVTVVNATTTGMLPVHTDATTSWLDLPLAELAVPLVAVR